MLSAECRVLNAIVDCQILSSAGSMFVTALSLELLGHHDLAMWLFCSSFLLFL